MELEKIEKEKLEALETESLEKPLKQQEKPENPQSLIEDAIKNIEQKNEIGISAEITKQTLQDILETIQEDDDITKKDKELNLFIAYQGVKETEQYVNSGEDFSLNKIKNSLAKELGGRLGVNLEDGTEIGEMVNLDQKLEATEEPLKEFSLLKEKDISLEEVTKHQQQFEQYSKLKQEVKRRQQEILGEQESFYKQYAEKISNGFSNAGKKIDNWALGKKLINFVGEHKIANRAMKTAAVGIIVFGAIGGIFNPDSSEAAEGSGESEKEDFMNLLIAKGFSSERAQEIYESRMGAINNYNESKENVSDESEKAVEKEIIQGPIELQIGSSTIYERSEKEGAKDLVKLARNNGVEDGWYQANNFWIDASDTVEGNAVHIDNELLLSCLKDLKEHSNEEGLEVKDVAHYHIHPASLALFEKFGEIGELRPIPPSLSDIKFYVKQENVFEGKNGIEFVGKVADLTGIWTVNSIDQERINEIFSEKMEKGEVSSFDDLYDPIVDKYIFGKDFELEDIDKFIKEVKALGIDLEYEVLKEDDLKNGRESLKKIAIEHLKTNDLNIDELPLNIATYFDKILKAEKIDSESVGEFEDGEYTSEEEATYQNNVSLIAEYDDLPNLKNDEWQSFLENKTLGDLMEILNENFRGSVQTKEIDLDTARKLNDFLKPHLESNSSFPKSTLLKDVILEIDV